MFHSNNKHYFKNGKYICPLKTRKLVINQDKINRKLKNNNSSEQPKKFHLNKIFNLKSTKIIKLYLIQNNLNFNWNIIKNDDVIEKETPDSANDLTKHSASIYLLSRINHY